MKRHIKIILISFIFLILLGFILFFYNKKDETFKPVLTEGKVLNEEEQLNNKITSIMNEMTIEEKISQMLIIEYDHEVADEDFISLIKKYSPGGLILFQKNMKYFDKTKELVRVFKSNSKIIPIISIDEEGGEIQRLKNFKDVKPTNIPSMYTLGKTNDTNLAYNIGKVIARDVRTLGVNVDFAPVVDVPSDIENSMIGDRSFSTDANIVSKMSISVAKGLEDNGVIPTFKHFPGHGDTITNSHLSLPVINKTYEEIKEKELKPFENAIKNNAKLIMVGHISYPKITRDYTPASLSKKIITDILINDLNYKGLIITDALDMGALQNDYTNEEIYTKAINAGVDLLLMPHDVEETITIIKENISEERIDASVKKILTFKYKYLKDNEFLDKSYLGSKEHQEIID